MVERIVERTPGLTARQILLTITPCTNAPRASNLLKVTSPTQDRICFLQTTSYSPLRNRLFLFPGIRLFLVQLSMNLNVFSIFGHHSRRFRRRRQHQKHC